MDRVVTVLMALALLFVATLVLEYVLSGAESPWPGRVLPILSGVLAAAYALLMVLNLTAEEGASLLLPAVLLLLACLAVGNIPTALYMVIYLVRRRKYGRAAQMRNMNIHDL